MTRSRPLIAALGILVVLPSCAQFMSKKYSSRLLMPHRRYCAEPHQLGLPAASLTLRSRDGVRLASWIIPRSGSRAAVLLLHGNMGNMSYLLLHARFLWRAGFTVMLVDYPGFGRSGGRPALITLDDAAVTALRALRGWPGIEPARIGIMGISLGSVIALAAAAETRAVGCIVVESIYEPARIMARLLRRRRLSPLAARLAAGLAGAFFFPDSLRPHRTLTQLSGIPILFIHGARDRLTPPRGAVRLFHAAPGPKRIWFADGAGHSPELLAAHDGEYQDQIVSFLAGCLSGGGTARDRGFPWRAFRVAPARYRVRLSPTVHRGGPAVPGQVTVIGSGGHPHATFRRWLVPQGAIEVEVPFWPAGVTFTPIHRVVPNGSGWSPRLTPYARSYRRMRRLHATLRRAGRARAHRLLGGVDPKSLDRRLHPQLGRHYYALARQTERAGQRRAALRLYRKSLALAPRDPRRHYEVGDARFSCRPPSYPIRARRAIRRLGRR